MTIPKFAEPVHHQPVEKRLQRLGPLLMVSVCVFFPNTALSTEPQESAEGLFSEGKALMEAKRLPEACVKLEQSQRLDPAAGTLLALAYCWEQAGLLASARRTYFAAAKLAEANAQEERVKAAKARAAALATRVSTLTLVIPPGLSDLEGFELKLNSSDIDRAALGAALPLDHGTYTVVVSAKGRRSWSTTVELRDEGQQQVLTIPMLDPAPAPTPPTPKIPPPKVVSVASPPPPLRKPNSLRIASLAAALGGVAGLGIGSVYGLKAASERDQSNAAGHCNQRGCDAQGLALRQEALSSARISTALFVGGAALLTGAAALYLFSDRSENGSVSSIALMLSCRSLSLNFERSF